MIIAYLLKDDDPRGGYFCAQDHKPDMVSERRTIVEVREVEIPDEVWQMVVTGQLPVDADLSNDSTWLEWWRDPAAKTIWIK